METLIAEWEAARDEWLKYLTWTGVKSKEGIRLYWIMSKACEALDSARFGEQS